MCLEGGGVRLADGNIYSGTVTPSSSTPRGWRNELLGVEPHTFSADQGAPSRDKAI